MKRVLILYRELAGYTVACINHLAIEYQVGIDVVAYPLNTDAPFQFEFAPGIRLESRREHHADSLLKKVKEGNYNLILVSGWADGEYLASLKATDSAVKVVGFDTWWNGTPKQYLAALYARIFIRPKFDFAFVPGPEQTELALKFGFPRSKILQGVYACDVPHFSRISEKRENRIEGGIKKIFYVGRYASEKFIVELCESMIELYDEGFTQWQLHCIGTGPLFDQRMHHACLVHHGFQQPAQLADLMLDGDAFVLPSTFEPWGVVVHEFAAAGYPLVLSSQVGARHAFLRDQQNGYLFRSGNREELKLALKRIMQAPPKKLFEMGALSSNLAKKMTPDTWAKTLYQFM